MAALAGSTPSLCAAPPVESTAEIGRNALRVITRAAADPDFEVRAIAAAAWGVIGNSAAQAMAQRAVKDKSVYVRIEAATSLAKLGSMNAAVDALIAVVAARGSDDESRGPQAEMRLLASDKSRVLAIERLSDFGGERAVALFERTLKDRSPAVRDATQVALAKMGLDEFGQQFFAALRSSDEAVRAAAVRAVGKMGTSEALAALREAAADRSVVVREDVMRALSTFGGAEISDVLAKGARDPDARVRARALSALAALSDAESTPVLRDVLKGKPTGEAELKALAGLARRGQTIGLDAVEAALGQRDADLRALALDVLRACEAPAVAVLLERMMEEDADPRLRVQAAALLLRRLQRRQESK